MKIGIVGAGSVGAAIGYSVIGRGLASRLVLADLDTDKAEGQAMDLRHCAAFIPPVEIQSGPLAAVRGMDVVVVATAVRRHAGEEPADHVRRSVGAVSQIAQPLARANGEAVFLVVSSPVDLLTLFLIRHGGISSGRAIGTGTLLDSSRLRHALAARFGVDARNVHAQVIGGRGPGLSVPLWSQALIGAMPADDYAQQTGIAFGPGEKQRLIEEVTRAEDEIVRRKGATYFAIAETVVRIVTAIARDERSILTLSVDLSGFEGAWNLCASLPVVVGRRGIVRTLAPRLAEDEAAGFRAALGPLRAMAQDAGI